MIPRQSTPRPQNRKSPKASNGTANNYQQALNTARATVHAQRQKPLSRANDYFHVFARKSSEVLGSPWAFATAITIIVTWALLGQAFDYSDTWQLVINTATTIVTFLMVFLLQNTQNRDARAIHLKLDELLHGVKGARNHLISLEGLSEAELDQLQKEFERVRKKAPVISCDCKEATLE